MIYTGSLAPADFSCAVFTHAYFQKIAKISSYLKLTHTANVLTIKTPGTGTCRVPAGTPQFPVPVVFMVKTFAVQAFRTSHFRQELIQLNQPIKARTIVSTYKQ